MHNSHSTLSSQLKQTRAQSWFYTSDVTNLRQNSNVCCFVITFHPLLNKAAPTTQHYAAKKRNERHINVKKVRLHWKISL